MTMHLHETAAGRAPVGRRRRRNGPVEVIRADPGLWREALHLAAGDTSRLRVQRDGTVVVLNRGRGDAMA